MCICMCKNCLIYSYLRKYLNIPAPFFAWLHDIIIMMQYVVDCILEITFFFIVDNTLNYKSQRRYKYIKCNCKYVFLHENLYNISRFLLGFIDIYEIKNRLIDGILKQQIHVVQKIYLQTLQENVCWALFLFSIHKMK